MSLMSVRETGDSGSTLPNGGAQCQITTQNLQDVTAQGVKPGMDHSAGLVWGRELPPGQMGTMGGGGISCLKSSSTACGKVWKLLFRFIWVPSTMAIFPNICNAQGALALELRYEQPLSSCPMSCCLFLPACSLPSPSPFPGPTAPQLPSLQTTSDLKPNKLNHSLG